jgi:small subunit ribosomal protein S6e
MSEFKLVIGQKDGKCVQKTIKDHEAEMLVGLKIGDKVVGDKIGLQGYEFEISGGSDYCGFPMRKDLPGTARKNILMTKGVGMQEGLRGMRKRKSVCGNTIHQKISQVNLKILKAGKDAIAADEKKEGEGDKKPARK